jgi:hypothetical protein
VAALGLKKKQYIRSTGFRRPKRAPGKTHALILGSAVLLFERIPTFTPNTSKQKPPACTRP